MPRSDRQIRIKREDWAGGILVGTFVRLRCRQRTRIADDNSTRDRLEGSAEMLHRLQRHDGFLFWNDAECLELLQVQHLAPLGRDENVDVGDAKNYRCAEGEMQASDHRSVADKVSVRSTGSLRS